MVYHIHCLASRSEISVDVELNSRILNPIKRKVFTHPELKLSLIINADHFFSDLKSSIVYVKVVKTHETFKQDVKGLFEGELVLNLIE